MIHICSKRDDRWRRLPASCAVATQYPKPDGLAYARWVQNVSPDWYESADQLAQAINGVMRSDAAPRLVMMDELKASTVQKIAGVARAVDPEFRGRFGAYLVNGSSVSYANLNPAVDALLDAGAVIAPEMYLKESSYRRHGTPYITRSVEGTAGTARLKWLVARKSERGSDSPIVGLVGLTPAYMDGNDSGGLIRAIRDVWERWTPGPLGAWKWDEGTATTIRPDWPGWGAVAL